MTTASGRHTLTLESCLEATGEASSWACTLAVQYGVDAERVQDLDLCVNELVANIADYAYAGGPGKIGLELNIDANFVELVVEDAGPAFNPLEFAESAQPSSLETATIGGFGIHLVRQFADTCHYERRNNRNRLTICFGECA